MCPVLDNWDLLIVTNSQFPIFQFYSFNRFLHCRGIEICNRNEIFVPLQCQMKVVETAGIKGKNCGN